MNVQAQLVSLDLETSCGVPTCPGYKKGGADQDEQEGKCKHALHHKKNKIDIVGVWDGNQYFNFKDDVKAFDRESQVRNWVFVFHGGKFDYKTLKAKGSAIQLKQYVSDTNLLGAAVTPRVTADYLEWYSDERNKRNALLPKGSGKHRPGTPLGLKTMAPFYLGVDPFWENPLTHDDPEYNKKDCIYTYNLYWYLLEVAKAEGTTNFHFNYQLPWTKLIIEAELEGILMDEPKLHKMYAEAQKDLVKQEAGVQAMLGKCFKDWKKDILLPTLRNKYKREETVQKHCDAITHFNLQSNPQMVYILKWCGIDVDVEKRDKATNEWIQKEGADKYVLKRAKVREKNEFAAQLLKYREKETEVGYLKQYIDATVDSRIHCSFNPTGTRSHRLSSSNPNLQNVKGALREPFIFADPDKYDIYPVDSSQIEPREIAYMTCSQPLIKLFQEGRDYHNYATHLFFPETRSTPENEIKTKFKELRNDVAKHGDLSLLYGTGAFTLQTMILTRGERHVELEQCELWCDEFRAGTKDILAWKKGLEDEYKKTGRIYNKFGAPVVPGHSVYMTLFNGLIQGQSSQTIFHASLMAFRHFCKEGIDARPLTWVHDEVIWRFPKHLSKYCREIVDHYMCCFKLETPYGRVPLKCEGHLGNAKEGPVWVK